MTDPRTQPQGSSTTGTGPAQVPSPDDPRYYRAGPLVIDTRTANIQPNESGDRARGLAGRNTAARIPLLMTTEVMAQQNRYIAFWCSPESVQWSLKLRGAIQETRGGMIQHYWRDNRRNTFFDEPEVTFTFQSGNILPVRHRQGTNPDGTQAESLSLPIGLLNLYEFIELLDQPKVMADGRTNYVYILYSSLMFPKIVLRGFFLPDTGTNFTESAQDNAEVKWSGTFRVAGSYPTFNSADSLAMTWRQVQESLGFDVQYAESAFTNPPRDQPSVTT